MPGTGAQAPQSLVRTSGCSVAGMQVDERKNELSSSTVRRALTGPGPVLPALRAPLPSHVRPAL